MFRPREVVIVDTEFETPRGDVQIPVCVVGHLLREDRIIRVMCDGSMPSSPFPDGPDVLYVAFFSVAEWATWLALGWKLPDRVLDLFCEFKVLYNGKRKRGWSLVDALFWHGLTHPAGPEKDVIRKAIGDGTWREKYSALEVLDYCQSDVIATAQLYQCLSAKIDLERALVRGRYMEATAVMEHAGVPIDTELLARLQRHWNDIKRDLIVAVDADYDCYNGVSFKEARFEAWLAERGIPWPRLPTGRLELKADTFRSMAKIFPSVSPLHELRATLKSLNKMDLAVGGDGRHRTGFSPFGSKTGRNTPHGFVFGPAVWLRALIKPRPGHALAYLDYGAVEFAVAAKLSGDEAMQEDYRSGDPYIGLARRSGTVPPDATKKTHPVERANFKVVQLGVLFGMTLYGIAGQTGLTPVESSALLTAHHRAYGTYWDWSERVANTGLQMQPLRTVFGWTRFPDKDEDTENTFRNFPMQANAGELFRLTCCLCTEAGLKVCAPVHDAILIEAPIDRIEADVATASELMKQAAADVLGGFPVRVDAQIFRYPERYMDEARGRDMFSKVMAILERLETAT